MAAFAAGLDQDLAALAEEFAVPVATVRSLRQAQALPGVAPQPWQRPAEFGRPLGKRSGPLHEAVAAAVVRASGVIENLNRRLRTYCFSRRQLGPGYLVW